MSKPVKELMRKRLAQRFEGVQSLAVVGFSGVGATDTHRIRGRLADKSIRMMVVKNSVARQAFREAGMEAAGGLLAGPCAIAFGEDAETTGVVTVIRELLDINKETPNLTVKAALLEGEVFGPDRVEELSEYPTREEAIGRVLTAMMSAGGRLAGALRAPAGTLASILKSIEEKQGGEEAA